MEHLLHRRGGRAAARPGLPADDADAARLSPLGDHHLNVRGRDTFIPPAGTAASKPAVFRVQRGQPSSSARPA